MLEVARLKYAHRHDGLSGFGLCDVEVLRSACEASENKQTRGYRLLAMQACGCCRTLHVIVRHTRLESCRLIAAAISAYKQRTTQPCVFHEATAQRYLALVEFSTAFAIAHLSYIEMVIDKVCFSKPLRQVAQQGYLQQAVAPYEQRHAYPVSEITKHYPGYAVASVVTCRLIRILNTQYIAPVRPKKPASSTRSQQRAVI